MHYESNRGISKQMGNLHWLVILRSLEPGSEPPHFLVFIYETFQ